MPRRTSPEIRVAEPIALGGRPAGPRQPAHLFPDEGAGHWQGITLLVLFAFVPLLISRPGHLVLDTDDRLFLDPGGALTSAAERWNPISALGSVRDRTFDSAFPMSPWFWAADGVGIPEWLAQRLWVGAIVLAAGLGFVFLLRTMSWTGRGWMLGALAYQSSPYLLGYAGTTSGVLLAWAGLPWLVGFTNRALTRTDWRDPARCAVVVALVASANLPASLYLAIGPAAWVLYSVVGARSVPWRIALRRTLGILVLCALVSLWWLTSFFVRPGDAARDIRANDPVAQVAEASTSTEIARGLGSWRLYSDDLTAAITAGEDLQSSPWLIGLGFVVPAVAITALVRTRFPNRLYFVSLLAVGAILAIGPHTNGDGEPVGRALRALSDNGIGALANPGQRALPLMWLGIAVGVAATVRRICEVAPRSASTGRVLLGLAILGGAFPLMAGQALDGARTLPDGVPRYWYDAAELVNEMDSDRNVIELPSMPRLGYTWGSTNRPISYALIDRPVGLLTPGASSEQGTADVLTELDRRIQRGDIAPRDIAPIARLLAADTIVVRADGLDDADRVQRVRELLDAAAGDVRLVGTFGSTAAGTPAVSVYTVERAPEPVRAVTPDRVVAMSGSSSGVLDLAQANVLDHDDTLVVPVHELVDTDFTRHLASGTPFVLTDTVRPEIDETGTVALPPADGAPSAPADGTLAGGGSPASEPTVAGAATIEWEGIDDVWAAPPDDEPADPGRRPALAFDGDRSTGWVVGAGRDPVSASITIDFAEPIRLDQITVRQPAAASSRLITEVRVITNLRLGDIVPLDATSRLGAGQIVPLDDDREIHRLTVVIAGVEGDPALGAGFNEITVPGVEPQEIVRVADDIGRLSSQVDDHPVTVVLSRWTATTPSGRDPETRIDRRFTLPTTAQYHLRMISPDDIGTTCRDDLVTVDGQPIPVRSAASLAPTLFELEPCDDDGLLLTAGDHRVSTQRRPTVTVERVVLEPEPLPVEELAPVELAVAPGRGTLVEIDVPPDAERFWLVRAASTDAGWDVELNGGVVEDLRTANGFAFTLPVVLTPAEDERELAIRWSPQRPINVAVLVSAAALLLVVFTAFKPARRRLLDDSVAVPVRADHLRYVHPMVIVIVSLGVFGLAAGPVPGIVAGFVALLLEQRPHLFNVAAWVPGALVLGAGTARAVWQATVAPDPGPAWPGGVPVLDVVVWTALALMVTIAYSNSDTRPLTRARGKRRRARA